MELIKKDYFDDGDMGYIGTRYFDGDEEIDEDTYYDLLDDEEDCVDELVQDTIDTIYETDMCPECLESILYEFIDNILEMFGYEDDEEYYEK